MKVKVSDIKHHPKNQEIYELSSIEDLMESIQEVGLLQPIIIDEDYRVISGNRRFESITINNGSSLTKNLLTSISYLVSIIIKDREPERI